MDVPMHQFGKSRFRIAVKIFPQQPDVVRIGHSLIIGR